MYGLTNNHASLTKGNFEDEFSNTVKHLVPEDYTAHTGYVNKNDQMSSSYGTCGRTWKYTKKLFFHLTDLVTINAITNYNDP